MIPILFPNLPFRTARPARTRAAHRSRPEHHAAPCGGPHRNDASALFRDLAAAWDMDAAGHRVDVLASELAALVARAPGPLCLGLITREAVPRYYGLVFLLDGYGVCLRKRHRKDGRSVFVFAEPKGNAPSEHAGTVVRELEPSALPQAA